MMYLFHGSDVEKVRRQAFAFVAAARAKQPELAYIRLAREELSPAALEEVASAGGLFVTRLLVLIDDPFSGEESVLEEKIEMLAASDNAIIILAPKLAAAQAKKITAKAAKVYEFNKAAAKEERGFNANLVNALAARDSKKLWLEVVRALRAGDPAEQIHGLLHWKARDLLEKRPSPAARELSLDLISLLMDSRRASLDLSEFLERWALAAH
jgi:DNA polymerase III delta subunit